MPLVAPSRYNEVVVQFLAPGRGRHERGLVVAPDDVAAENISARGKPNVRVQTGTNRDVVLNHASKAFTVLDTTMQAQIVGNDLFGLQILRHFRLNDPIAIRQSVF